MVFSMVEISVILYVFNDYEFLKESLNSILNQSFKDFEIICMDDESTDNSLSLLQEYSGKDNRITVSSHKHVGLSSSINNAMKYAKGKYLYFTNPGTLMEENAFERMHKRVLEEETDLIIADIRNYDSTYDNYYANDKYSISKLLNKTDKKTFNLEDMDDLIFEFQPTLENKLYSTEFLKQNNIHFDEDSLHGEYIFYFETFLSAQTISCIDDVLFTHLDYYTSLNNRKDNVLLDILSSSDKIMNLFRKYGHFENYKILYNYKFNLDIEGYNRINELYKDDYFNRLRTGLISIIRDDKVGDDFLENISDYNRKLFEQIIISENFYEFDRVRKAYFEKTEYYKLINQKKYLKPYMDKMNQNSTKKYC